MEAILVQDCTTVTRYTPVAERGFPILRHNEVRDITVDLLSEVCSAIAIEPTLHPLSGECLEKCMADKYDEARLDVSAKGVWCRGEAFFYIWVFYPNVQWMDGWISGVEVQAAAQVELVIMIKYGTDTKFDKFWRKLVSHRSWM